MTAPIAQNQYTESKMAEALKVDTETNCNQQIQITEHFFFIKIQYFNSNWLSICFYLKCTIMQIQ